MKRKTSRLRLSPNEEARIIREEQDRRRKLRLQQVREQQRCIAFQIRREVEQRRQRELQLLEDQLRLDWEQRKRGKLLSLHSLYQESLKLLGQGHRSAKENEPDLAAIAQLEEENHFRAELRYREALKELKSQKLKDHEKQNQVINARKKALQTEKERSAKVASLPSPPPDPLQIIHTKKPHIVRTTDISAYATTHYHIPEIVVDNKVDILQPSAVEGAEVEEKRQQEFQREENRRREEQQEKARLRGRRALRKEQLVQDHERLLVELERMQQTDRLRRRQQAPQMPAQIFQPLSMRQAAKEDYQREMEFAFEDMYSGERRIKGDLVVQLLPEPLPAVSPCSQDQDPELDVTLDDVKSTETDDTHSEAEQESQSTEQENCPKAPLSRPPPRQALRKLLDRIRKQRDQISDPNSHVPATGSLSSYSDQIPERDSTIETGSLLSERHRAPPVELLELVSVVHSDHVNPAEKMVGLQPAVNSFNILPNQEFEEERRQKEEVLEREKQQQAAVVQELEEQKAKLEQMLLEAERERERLAALVIQESSRIPPGEEDVTSVSSQLHTERVRPATEDQQTRRIKEHQQRLLHQNRVHQRTVEVARQRLEDYQREIQIRYSATAASLPSSVVPAGRLESHLLADSQLPAQPQENLQSFVEKQMDVRPASPPRPNKLRSDQETLSDAVRKQRPHVTSFLTHRIMESVTEHLPQRLRPSPLTTEPTPCPPLQRASRPLQDINWSNTQSTFLIPEGRRLASTVPGEPVLGGCCLTSREKELQGARQREREILERRKIVRAQQEEELWELLKARQWEAPQWEAQRLELQEAQRFGLQEAPWLELKEAQRRELQEAQRFGLQEVQQLELQEAQQLELQEAQKFGLKEAPWLELQEAQRQELQEAQRFGLQEAQHLELQETQRQELQEAPWLELKEARRQELKEARRQELQEAQQLELKEAQRFGLQEAEQLELQEAQQWEREILEKRKMVRAQQEEVLRELLKSRRWEAPQRELQDVHGREIQEAERLELQEAQQLELKEAQQRVLEQREAVTEQQLQQKEDTWQQELQRDQMRRQKEALQALISTHTQSFPESSREPLVSDSLNQDRLRLLSSLLRAIEKSHGGTLSHLEASEEAESSAPLLQRNTVSVVQTNTPPPGLPPLSSALPSRVVPPPGPQIMLLTPPSALVSPPRAPKPPVTRVRLGFLEKTEEQHELSVIEEVDTPINSSSAPGLDDSARVSSHSTKVLAGSDAALVFDVHQQTGCPWSSRQQTEETTSSLEESIHPVLKEMLRTGAETSPELSDRDLVQRLISPGSSDSVRGADVSVPSSCSSRSFRESLLRPTNLDFISSTISTGSYITTSPEQNLPAEKSDLIEQHADQSSTIFSPSEKSVCVTESSPAGSPAAAVDSLFNESSIQRIIDRYTRELDLSLGTTGRTTADSDGSYMDAVDTWTSSIGASESRREDESSSTHPSDESGARSLHPGVDASVPPSVERLPADDPPPEAQDSFHPLIGQPADQSSCLAADQRDSSWEQLVGQPSAHSSMISHPPGIGWDSTLSHMIGQLTGQSGAQRQSGEAHLQVWLDEAPQESQMRALVAELDDSTEQSSGISGERSLVTPSLPSPPGAPTHGRSDGETSLDHPDTTDLHADRTGVVLDSESFHPLQVEVTHNGSTDASLSFHPTEHSDEAKEPEPSPERLRSDEAAGSWTLSTSSQGSSCRFLDSPNPAGREPIPLVNALPRNGEHSVTDLKQTAADSHHVLGKGILEQSDITLVSLTDTTLTEQDEEEEQIEMSDSQSSPGENLQSHADLVLESLFGPDRDLQEVQQKKLRVLLLRSKRRVEQIKAKRTRSKTPPRAADAPDCPSQTSSRLQRGRAGRAAVVPEKPRPPSPGDLQEVKTCTPQQRKQDLSSMRRRTRRLYEQLEEVKQQRAVRSRQEEYAMNRLKAKEFHKKTLQKLRAKETT